MRGGSPDLEGLQLLMNACYLALSNVRWFQERITVSKKGGLQAAVVLLVAAAIAFFAGSVCLLLGGALSVLSRRVEKKQSDTASTPE